MRSQWRWLLLTFMPVNMYSQTLTVEKIMRDPKWIGTSPSNLFWSYDSKVVYFDWNPENKTSDSTYRFDVKTNAPVKSDYAEAGLLSAMGKGQYNREFSGLVYSYRGDIFLRDLKLNKTVRITRTEDTETNPSFIRHDGWVVFTRNQNLFAWEIKTGSTEQLTNFIRTTDMTAPGAGTPVFRGGGGGGGNGTRGSIAVTEASRGNLQELWLQREQLRTSQVLTERKKKRDERLSFLKTVRDKDTLKAIHIGDKQLQALQSSPDGRFITYRLFIPPPTAARSTVVPDYVTESGFTTDIPNRTKVGAEQGRYEYYLYDTQRDTVMQANTDSLPGIFDPPGYTKDYPVGTRKPVARPVNFGNTYWNESGTRAVVEIRSQDHKDRWIVALDPLTGKFSVADRQRDEAWIGGPGIFGNLGWIDDHTIYFQSEATGYSHLYSFDFASHSKKALTQGNYEVQQLELSRDKKYFYLLTNETHPGKQQWYRIKTDGSRKEQITGVEGQYQVVMSPDEKYIAFRYSYTNKPWELYIQENMAGKKRIQVTDKAMSDEYASYPWRDTRIFTIRASDGQPVYTRLYEPASGTKNGAAVVFVHGAGYLQNVHFGWSSYFREYMFNNLLADRGYTVLDIDYRGSSGYGRDWRTGIYRHMGGKDLDDEVDAAKFLVTELGIDPKRIGIYGGSYGGFMTLMALFTKPDVFQAGAALRPVTDWAHYNHEYTSNILNEPFNDSLAYERSSPINYAAGLKNHLLMCHGMVDQNVNFQDDVRLVQKLIELGKDNWELAVYPVEDHGFVEPSSWTDEYKRILKLFNDTLLPK